MTTIEWTNETWNPLRGCSVVSPGCANCYAMKQAHRFSGPGGAYEGLTRLTERSGPQWTGSVVFAEDRLQDPLHWKQPRRIFVNSMSDLFHESVPFEWIDRIFEVMWLTPHHTYQVLTKRVDRMVDYVQSRSSRRHFGWIERDRTPLHPGEVIHFDDIRMRNMCGHVGDEYACKHPHHKSVPDSCDPRDCPIADRLCDRDALIKKVGLVEGRDFTADGEGYVDDSEWMELRVRPLHAAPGNVWLGFSAEDQERFNQRARQFQALRWILGPHFTLFASLEPLIAPISMNIPEDPKAEDAAWSPLHHYNFGNGCQRPYLDWVIVGGESGNRARPCAIDWIDAVAREVLASDTALFVKQLGSKPIVKDGRRFDSHAQWVNKAQSWLGGVSGGGVRHKKAETDAVCIDQRGRVLRRGADFQRAHTDQAFPVEIYRPLRLADGKGGDPREWPASLPAVRQFPEVAA